MKKKAKLYVAFGVLLLISNAVSGQIPSISDLSLSATSPDNLTIDSLVSTYSTNGSVVETASAWYKNGTPEAIMYLPFEGGPSNYFRDYSGNSNNAWTSVDPTMAPTWDPTGGHNGSGAFVFDGNDYLNVGDIFPLNSSYTKAAWVNADGTGYRNIITSVLQGDNNHIFEINSDTFLVAGHSAGPGVVRDNERLNTGEWYFVALTFEFSSGEMKLYKNGVLVDVGYVSEAFRSIVDPSVLIGAMEYHYAWEGSIDDPRIYDHVLSSEQINSLYVSGKDITMPEETNEGDVWYVDVTPFSVSDVGSTTSSNTITIQTLAAPVISGLALSASSSENLTIDDLEATYTSGTTVMETASTWFKNGVSESVLYLPFEAGSIKALMDFSGNNNHASNSGDPVSKPIWGTTSGYNGNGAFTFDGDDYLKAGDILPVNNSYTKTAWINISGSGYRNIMSSILHGSNNHFLKVNADGTLNAGHSTGGDPLTVQDGTALNPDEWYFVAVTFDYTSGQMILYKNGSEVDRGTVPEALRSVADPSVLIGSLGYTFGWVGIIDEPRIYNRALSGPQVQSLFSDGNDILVSEETSGLEEWYLTVTPFSRTTVGNTYTSNTLTIRSIVVDEISNQTIAEGSSFSTINLNNEVIDYEFSDSELDWTFTGNSNLSVAIDDVTHIATITVNDVNWFGSENITFTASNPNTGSDSDIVTFTVTNVNDAPVLTDIGNQSTNEDNDLNGRSVVFGDLDPGDSHSITVVSNEANVVVENLSGNSSGSTYNLAPAANWHGSAQITVTVTDDGTGTLFDSETYTLTVNAINDTPVLAEIGNQTSNEDNTLSGLPVVFTDADASDVHTIAVVSSVTNVTVENLNDHTSGSTYDLVPAADWNGTAQITVTVTDDGTGALFDSETYTLTVNPINDAPVLTYIGDQVTDEDNALTGLTVTFTDLEASDSHTIDVVSSEPNVTIENLSGHVSGSTYDLVPAADWNGTAQITVTVTDDGPGVLFDSETYTLTVNAGNDAPVITSIGDQATDEDNTLGLSVIFTDLEASDAHAIAVVSSEPNVTVENLSGHISGSTYDLVPAADWNGTAQITVTVTDDGAGALFDSETYTLTVNAVNDAPESIGLSNNTIDENVESGTAIGVFTSIDIDIDDTHQYELIPIGGTVDLDNESFIIVGDTLKTNAEINYEQKSSYSIYVQSDDGNGGITSQTVIVTINDVVETFVEESNNNLSFNVYPVPAIDKVTVEIDNPENRQLLLEIYTNTGMLVHSEQTINGNTVYLTEYPGGMYILSIRGESIFETRKIIVGDR